LGNNIDRADQRNPRPKTPTLRYSRIIVKISGEMLGSGRSSFRTSTLDYVAQQVRDAATAGARIGIVIGGGNIMRGKNAVWLDRIAADFCGMTATVINGIVLQQFLIGVGLECRLSGGMQITGLVDQYHEVRDRRFFDNGGVPIFVGGTGNPLFTTDTAAALRAAQMRADLLIKGTKVAGVYSADPRRVPGARRYRTLSYNEAIRRNLGVMDQAAFAICREARVPICVYDFMKHRLVDVVTGGTVGTLVG